MNPQKAITVSYFPGCSLATSARENNLSLIEVCKNIGVHLMELEDWSCCGSSSAHSVDAGLALDLAARNLFLAPLDRPLLIACPSCNLRLRHAFFHLLNHEDARTKYKKTWGKAFNPKLKLLHFFELFDELKLSDHIENSREALKGIRFVPYYGCMLSRPPEMRHEKNFYGLMEKVLSPIGAEPLQWAGTAKCCGTFLSAARPDVVTNCVDEIVKNARKVGAECIVTACSMCHLNLEMRCTRKERIPIFHFSELLSLAMGTTGHMDWFARHLVDPVPLLKEKKLIS